MGSRGASSGRANNGKAYGTEYRTVLKAGNIKFVIKNEGSSTAPMETMTRGRVYVTVNDKQEISSISYYDKDNKRVKQIDLNHTKLSSSSVSDDVARGVMKHEIGHAFGLDHNNSNL